MAGYTRQSVADIVNGSNITAPPLNAELNQLAAAFDPASGHSHDGSSGNSPKIDLTTSISGYLPAIHGGIGGKNNTQATVNPTTADDFNDGYAPGSLWLNSVNGRGFICITNTVNNAVWAEVAAISPNNRITAEVSNTVDIGSSVYQFKDIYIDGTGYIDAVSGDTITLTSNASVGGNLTLTGNYVGSGNFTNTGTGYFGGNVTANTDLAVNGTFNAAGDVNLGNATSDTVTFISRVDSSIIPSADGTYNLGSTTQEWQNLYIDGTAEIDQLNADSVDIDNGNIDNTVIGAGTRASGAFTGLTVDGVISFASATVSNLGNVTTADINGGTIDGVTIGTNSAVTDLRVDNLKVDGNAITSTNANGNIDITPNGTGEVNISKVDIDSGTIDNTVIGATTPAAGTFTTVTTTGQATLATADINGGTIDNTTIGATTPSSGAFTTVSASGGFTGDVIGNVTGNLTGNITGNITGDVTGDLTGNVTAATGTSTFNDVTVNGTLDVTGTTIANVTDPSSAQDAATKNYVDTNDALKVTKAGDTMTGNLTMSGGAKITGLPTPTATSDAANKSYVDTEVANLVDSAPGALDTLNELAEALGDDPNFSATISAEIATKLPKAGGTMSGDIAMGANAITGMADPTLAQDAATKNYVDTNDALKLNLTGGTMTGDITMGANQVTTTANPVSNDDMARKGYVDTQDALKLSLTGGTMSGVIDMGSNKVTSVTDPTNAQDAATKNYIDTIFGSTSAAATSAANAATSETNAANSATLASTSETNAATSEANAAASYDDFDDRYLGPKATAPTVDNDGDALILGSLYFNTASDTMQVYGSSGWVPAGSSVNGTSARFKYTATAAQTTFSGNDDNAETLAYDSGYLDVYLNGIRLVNGSDFTATTGTSIQLTTGAAVNDVLEVVAFGTFTLSNQSIDDMTDVALGSIADGQFLQWEASNSRFVPATVATDLQADTSPQLGGNLDLNSNDITGTGNINNTGTITTDGLTVDGVSTFHGNGNAPLAWGDTTDVGFLSFDGSGNAIVRSATGKRLDFQVNANRDVLSLANGSTVFNEPGHDQDFRVESNGNTHALFVDAGNNSVKINSNSTTYDGGAPFQIGYNATTTYGPHIQTDNRTYVHYTGYGGGSAHNTFIHGYQIDNPSSGGYLRVAPGLSNNVVSGVIQSQDGLQYVWNSGKATGDADYTPTTMHEIGFGTGGNVVFNQAGADIDFRVESNNNANTLFVDAGNDRVCIGHSSTGLFTTSARFEVDATSNSRTAGITTKSSALSLGLWRTTDGTIIQFANGTNGVGVGGVDATSSGVTYNTTSDRRLKDNIEPIANGTEKLMAMKPVTHTWVADPEADAVHGFIAQEMQEIVPEAVSGDPDGEEMMSMDYGRITPVLVAALQDAHKKIEALEARINEMEAK